MSDSSDNESLSEFADENSNEVENESSEAPKSFAELVY